ncbi:hypothetical protein C2845_PM08G06280 [Panicum miliaceum]|uniref:Uncharacterized protein n=1 Tax=Panicum miliaceum TaxID=4540 RepID=A0A3L6R5K0_PANMI|nr:hypothetical protein C2845_PM08G06280 [Panicum miliaceum]
MSQATASSPHAGARTDERLRALSTSVKFGSNHQQQQSTTAPHVLPHLPGPAMQVLEISRAGAQRSPVLIAASGLSRSELLPLACDASARCVAGARPAVRRACGRSPPPSTPIRPTTSTNRRCLWLPQPLRRLSESNRRRVQLRARTNATQPSDQPAASRAARAACGRESNDSGRDRPRRQSESGDPTCPSENSTGRERIGGRGARGPVGAAGVAVPRPCRRVSTGGRASTLRVSSRL